MFFRRKENSAGNFDYNAINHASYNIQSAPYELDRKFIQWVIGIVVAFHVVFISYFALEGFLKDLFKPKENFVTVELTDFAAYASENNDFSAASESMTEETTDPVEEITPDEPTTEITPVVPVEVPDNLQPQAVEQAMFDQPTLKIKPKPPKPPKNKRKKNEAKKIIPTKPPKNATKQVVNPGKKGGKGDPYKPPGRTDGNKGGTGAQKVAYIKALAFRLESKWNAPNQQQVNYRKWRVLVEVRVSGAGKVIGVRILKKSGNIFMDNSVTVALNQLYGSLLPKGTPTRRTETFKFNISNTLEN
ncbi:TonB C-terminal domain-containing protein [Lentisphaerota bacterium WC36G]|nr:TonB C-terminal domain-containing protein [Lentisphaerae bacterium WC36]